MAKLRGHFGPRDSTRQFSVFHSCRSCCAPASFAHPSTNLHKLPSKTRLTLQGAKNIVRPRLNREALELDGSVQKVQRPNGCCA